MVMDIKKEQNSFKKTMLDQHGEYDEEHFELDGYGNFSWIGTDDHFEIWMLCAKAKQAEIDELKAQLAKAQAVPEGLVLVPRVITDEWMAVYIDPVVSSYCKDYEALPFSVEESELPEIRESYRLPVRNAHRCLMRVIEAQEQNQ